MNCDDFEIRLQHTIDERVPLTSDVLLTGHADGCAACQDKLNVWLRIESVMPPQPRVSRRVPMAAALAASVLFAVALGSLLREDPKKIIVAETDSLLAQADPSGWWSQVRQRDWVGETMPAVRSVREGVAPLGRSLLQAVTILTIPNGERTT